MSQAANHDADSSAGDAAHPGARGQDYVVVARRYRPQTFDELVGQQQAAHALKQAIASNRVGHAYLFTGARGVGKTSAARIFAKALNCVEGPTQTPCNACESCVSIATGEDVDVLEIDGASNRGIDEVRQMRANVNIRPSRSRSKVYIIDEVHMLTLPAFNALLKTLEEPPEHVKFIFCTTEPKKLPITVLSRCQRFDFAGIQTDSICERLRQIVDAEGARADEAALKLLARRAAGSMRDGQSLLEQLLAFGTEQITEDDVHNMLGTARGGQLAELAGCLIARDAAGALGQLDAALRAGVDPGQLVEQVLGYFRDMMAVLVGCQPDMLLYCSGDDFGHLKAAGEQMGLTTVLAVQQILDHTLTQSRQSVQVRTLAELAIVRICQLDNLDDLARLIARLKDDDPGITAAPPARSQAGSPATRPSSSGSGKAASRPAPRSPAGSGPSGEATVPSDRQGGAAKEGVRPDRVPDRVAEAGSGLSANGNGSTGRAQALTDADARRAWDETLATLGDMTAEFASRYSHLAIRAPNTLEITFSSKYTSAKNFCERPEKRKPLEQALSEGLGKPISLVFRVEPAQTRSAPQTAPRQSQRELIREKAGNPMVRKAMELFDAHVMRVDPPRNPPADAS